MLGGSPAANSGPLRRFAVDGKTARGSFDGLEKAVHLLSVVAHESGLTVAQTEVPQGGTTRRMSTKPPSDCWKEWYCMAA